MGEDVHLLRTEDVAAHYPELTFDGKRPMVIQPYIEHSEDGCPTECGVLSMFGRVLYCARNRWGAARRPLEEIASDPNGIITSNDKTFGRVRTVCDDPPRSSPSACGRIPPFRNVRPWQSTSSATPIPDSCASWRPIRKIVMALLVGTIGTFTAEHIRDLAQFSALDRVADLLVEKTRAQAT